MADERELRDGVGGDLIEFDPHQAGLGADDKSVDVVAGSGCDGVAAHQIWSSSIRNTLVLVATMTA